LEKIAREDRSQILKGIEAIAKKLVSTLKIFSLPLSGADLLQERFKIAFQFHLGLRIRFALSVGEEKAWRVTPIPFHFKIKLVELNFSKGLSVATQVEHERVGSSKKNMHPTRYAVGAKGADLSRHKVCKVCGMIGPRNA
jgi:hypothetical protein